MPASAARRALVALLLLAAPATAQELATGPWYVGLDLTFSMIGDTRVSEGGDGRISYDDGLTLSGLKLGYRPAGLATSERAYRFELELGGRAAPIDRVHGTGNRRDDGDLEVGALMANAYLDHSPDATVSPYLGIGLGSASASFTKNPGLGIADKESGETVMAGQFMAGLSFRRQEWVNTRLTAGYRFFGTDDMNFDGHGRDPKLEAFAATN